MTSPSAPEATPKVLLRTVLSRLWRPAGFAGSRTTLALHRAWVVSLPGMIISLLITPVALALYMLLGRFPMPVWALCDLIALGLLSPIFRTALRLWTVLPGGVWIRHGVPVRREEQPLRFWAWSVVEGLALAVTSAAAIFLVGAGLAAG